ncbi:MAG TPA: multiheme c-type cytochrome, partial [Acidobacteriota bacterium]
MSERAKRYCKLGFLILALNSAYLWAVADASVLYVANLYLHVGLGLLLLLPVIAWSKRPADLPGGWLSGILLLVLLLGMLAGVAILWTGGTRPYSWLVTAHIAVASIALLALALIFGARALRVGSPRERRGWSLALAALVLAAAAIPVAQRHRQQRDQQLYSVSNPTAPPLTMDQEGGGAGTEFFPSSIQVKGENTGSSFFMNSESCGRSGCHPDIVEQWQSSAHRFSSFNNQWYRKSIEYMQSVVGEQPSKWCGGCHDPAILLTGRMNDPVETFIDTPEAHVGLGCVMCHAVVEVNDTMGNAGMTVEIPPLHDLATSDNPVLQFLHDTAVRLDPEPHRRTFMKPFHRQQPSEFCSTCHKVHLDVPVNHYRWIRGFNEYDAWQASGVSGHGARSFYYPPESSTCTKCHMPTVASEDMGNVDGLVHNHRFAAANTAVPLANQDHEQLKQVIAFLQNNVVRVDLFGLQRFDQGGGRFAEDGPIRQAEPVQRAQSSFAEVEELGFATGVGAAGADVETLLAPLDREIQAVRRGESVRLEAVVRTLGVGHFFPGGTVDAFDVWLEL